MALAVSASIFVVRVTPESGVVFQAGHGLVRGSPVTLAAAYPSQPPIGSEPSLASHTSTNVRVVAAWAPTGIRNAASRTSAKLVARRRMDAFDTGASAGRIAGTHA